MQSDPEVRPQRRDLGGLYGGPGPAPGAVTTFWQSERSKTKHGTCPEVGLQVDHRDHSGKEELPSLQGCSREVW